MDEVLKDIKVGTIFEGIRHTYKVISLNKRNILEEYNSYQFLIIKTKSKHLEDFSFNWSFDQTVESIKLGNLKIIDGD